MNILKRIGALMLSLCLFASLAVAQVNPQEPVELDKNVRYGKLENGLTYYILHNAKPENRAEFYIATNAGAIDETPDQDGLAHFLEHMCFNGTQNFPGKGIISYMESIGCKFGENINASTGVEATQYMLNNVPITRDGIIDTALLILHDYSAFVNNDQEEIDSERGVILEEKRTRNTVSWRSMMALRKALFTGTKMADCSIIGSEENLKTFKRESLVNFYKTWYHPDMQAIIVVGDVDVDAIEEKIKNTFGHIERPENPQERAVHTVPNNEEPIVSIFTDKEQKVTTVSLFIKSEALPKQFRATGVAVLQDVLESLISAMLNERLSDISKSPNAPFLQASAGFGGASETLDIFSIGAAAKDGEGLKALTAMEVELERAKRFGFTEDEYERAKTNLLRSYEVAKENAGDRQNGQLVYQFINHFNGGWAYTTPETDYNNVQLYLQMLPLAAINQAMSMAIPEVNRVLSFQAPEKEGLVTPTEEELLEAMAAGKEQEITAPEALSINEPLLDATQLKGSAVKSEKAGEFGTTILTLANGIEVYIKPTEYKKDQVMINIESKGGKSILPVELLPSLESNIYSLYLSNAGISNFSESTLEKILTGKAVSVSPYMSERTYGINAGGSPKDLETMLQLAYLYYTAPRFEAEDFEVGFNQIKSILPNLEKQPSQAFSTAIQKALNNGEERKPVIESALLEKVSIDNLKKAYQTVFADAAGSKVFITGNVNIDEIKPLLEKYIGSLPIKSKKGIAAVEHNYQMPKGQVDSSFEFEMQEPKVSTALLYTGKMERTLENEILMDALDHVLDQNYTKTMREDEGGTYGVSTQTNLSGDPREEFFFLIVYDTQVEKSQKMIELAKDGINVLLAGDMSSEYITKTKENLIKAYPEKLINNGYWASIVKDFYTKGLNMHDNYLEIVEKVVTPENLQKFAKELFEQGNCVDVVMSPKN